MWGKFSKRAEMWEEHQQRVCVSPPICRKIGGVAARRKEMKRKRERKQTVSARTEYKIALKLFPLPRAWLWCHSWKSYLCSMTSSPRHTQLFEKHAWLREESGAQSGNPPQSRVLSQRSNTSVQIDEIAEKSRWNTRSVSFQSIFFLILEGFFIWCPVK